MKINVDLIYPIGSIYMSTLAVNPETLFGGKWTKIEGRFLLGSSSAYSLGSTGGEETHKLTISEMPSHHHDMYAGWTTGNAEAIYYNHNNGNTTLSNACQFAGGDQPHNNMPPYQVVNIWRRTS